jgi:hypothetical protein
VLRGIQWLLPAIKTEGQVEGRKCKVSDWGHWLEISIILFLEKRLNKRMD